MREIDGSMLGLAGLEDEVLYPTEAAVDGTTPHRRELVTVQMFAANVSDARPRAVLC